MNSLLVVGLFAAMALVCSAGDYAATSYNGNYAFNGYYPGKCGNDGFYYKDYYSFVICSNGNSYDQPCAPGTRNSEYGRYNNGHNYSYRDFCDVNLVDYGYGVRSPSYGYAAPAYGYAAPVYGYGQYAAPAYVAPRY